MDHNLRRERALTQLCPQLGRTPMMFANRLKSTLLMGAIATAVAGCIGNVGGPEDSDELVAQREEALLHGIDPAKELVITDLSVIE